MLPDLEPVTAALLLVLGFLLYRLLSKPSGFPPGPPALPIIGSIPFIPDAERVTQMVKKYGKIVGMYMGPMPIVFIYDFKVAKEILNRDEFSGRPITFQSKARSFNKIYGVILNDGIEWQEQRRFALKTLKDFGFGKKGLEGVLQEEVQNLVDFLRETGSQPVNMQNMFNVAIINVLWNIVANKRFKLNDPRLAEIVALLTEVAQSRVCRAIAFTPWLRFLIPEKWSGVKRDARLNAEICSMLRTAIREHRASYQEDNMRDFMDVYLREIQKNEKTSFHDDQMIIVCLDLFQAGAETTATTLAWAVLFMLLHPDVQRKVQQEIDENIGHNRLPCIEDRGNLPYTEATIMEIQRVGTITPHAVGHKTLTNVDLEGYRIKANTSILYSVYYMHHDPEYWDDPDTFNPPRFLDARGNVIKKDAFLPFGIGKRQCLGESLAKMELFFFFTGLLQHFTFSLPENDPTPTLVGSPGLIRGPRPYRAIVTPRF